MCMSLNLLMLHKRFGFVARCGKKLHDGLADPQLLFVTDKAYFHFSCYINSQNT
jgi:hypothetical protein